MSCAKPGTGRAATSPMGSGHPAARPREASDGTKGRPEPPPYLSWKYRAKPTAANIALTIQKRMTTFVSLHPFFSKWW